MSETVSTIKLYDQDAYAVEFTAQVISCEKISYKKKECFAVLLDRTLFFPEEGGQSPDTGSLGGAKVLDVQIKQNKETLVETITHYIDRPLEAGSEVSGKIDWQHRFSNMQQHSGEHIFSGLVSSRFGYHNVGFHLSDQIVTMDYDGMLSEKDVEELEYAANEAIVKNVPVTVTFPSKEELKTLDYRSKIEIAGQVRIVTIEGIDVCACCAPHVRRTGEIGLFKVMNVSKNRGGVRISMLCGFRALKAFREKSAIVSGLVDLMTTAQENLRDNVVKLRENNQDLKLKLGEANKKLMEYELAALDPEQEHVLLFKDGLEEGMLRNTVNELVKRFDGFCGVFAGNDENGYRFVIGSKERDCKALAGLMREKLRARGGGSPQMIQGSVAASKEEIEAIF